MKTRKIWLGLGAAALSTTLSPLTPQAASSPTAIDAVSPSTHTHAVRLSEGHSHGAAKTDAAAKPDAGGEGGEGSAAKVDADARLDPTLRFYRDIQLVRGHILVGNELVKSGLWADALPHFLHPVEELYDKLSPQLKTRKSKPFLQQLKALAQTVKAKNATAYDAALAALNTRLDLVDTAMKTEKKDWMPFAVETALETMRSAIGEYTESIADGKFTKAVEYQDSRGFVFQAERLLVSVNAPLTAKFPDAAAKLRTGLDELKTAWPAAVPPSAPVLEPSKVAATISKLELALGNVK